MSDKLTIAVVDDHPLMRAGIEYSVKNEPGFDVIATGSTADDAIRISDTLSPSVMLLDIDMPGGGLMAAKEIARRNPQIKILFLTVSERQEDVAAALEAGARGYILKGISGADLVRTINSVIHGETYITPEFAARLLASPFKSAKSEAQKGHAPDDLTAREEQILTEVSRGLTNKEIGRKLELSEKTIKHYMSGVLQKLSARNRIEAVLLSKQRKD